MSEQKPPTKSKNKKKKSKSNTNPIPEITQQVDAKEELVNAFPLPTNINERTYYNGIEVSIVEQKQENPAPKKKKNSKKKTKEAENNEIKRNSVEMANSHSADKSSPLNFTEGGNIELINLPEVSITPAVKEPEHETQSGSSATELQGVADSTDTGTSKKKKKKKKKKKAGGEEDAEDKDKDKINNAENPDTTTSEPSYVKLPGVGDNCVLLVSHENFGRGDTTKNNSAESNIQSQSAVIPPTNPSAAIAESKEIASINAVLPNISLVPVTSSTATTEKPITKVKVNTNKFRSIGVGTVDFEKKASKKEAKAEKQAEKVVQEVTKMAKQSLDATGKSSKAKPSTKSCQVSLFAHLPQYKNRSTVARHLESKSSMHPAIIAVGAQYADGIISGSNARCVSILIALKEVIKDYETPQNKELSRDLDAKFQDCLNFVAKCRPLAVSMCNAVKVMKHHINSLSSDLTDLEAKDILYTQIDKFINEEIVLAMQRICEIVTNKITDGDVILTYAFSSVVKDALCDAWRNKKNFRVIVVDSRPRMEGKQMLKCLLDEGINCSYIFINGISYVMREVTKVIVGAHALQANGYVMSRVGTSQIALVSSAYNVPFLVCCETYKFCERVHTDSFVYNELGDPESFLNVSGKDSNCLKNWKDKDNLRLLNLLYDITPPQLVSMVITEKGMLPCTSVPVMLRVRHSGAHD